MPNRAHPSVPLLHELEENVCLLSLYVEVAELIVSIQSGPHCTDRDTLILLTSVMHDCAGELGSDMGRESPSSRPFPLGKPQTVVVG